MFPEYRSLISKLKEDDAHFLKLFNKHNQLDKEILELEKGYISNQPIIQLKKEKLKIKDELYTYLKSKASIRESRGIDGTPKDYSENSSEKSTSMGSQTNIGMLS